MAATFKLDRLDRAGIIEALKSPGVQRELVKAAGDVAGRVRLPQHHQGQVPVTVNPPHEARFSAASSVSLAHPAGMGIEAKYGVLRKAAGGGE